MNMTFPVAITNEQEAIKVLRGTRIPVAERRAIGAFLTGRGYRLEVLRVTEDGDGHPSQTAAFQVLIGMWTSRMVGEYGCFDQIITIVESSDLVTAIRAGVRDVPRVEALQFERATAKAAREAVFGHVNVSCS